MDSAVTGGEGGGFRSRFTLAGYRAYPPVSSSETDGEQQGAAENHRWESSKRQETEVALPKLMAGTPRGLSPDGYSLLPHGE